MDHQHDRPPPLHQPGGKDRAVRRDGMLLGPSLACILAAVILLAAPLLSDAVPAPAFSTLAGMLLLASAGFIAALLLVQARAGESPWRSWPQPALAIAAALLAATVILGASHTDAEPGERALLATGCALVVLAFPVLVLERAFSAIADDELSEAFGLTGLLRAVLLVQVGLGLALALQGGGFPTAGRAIPVCAALVLLVAAEFLLRGIAACFLPRASSAARPAATSLLATWIRLRAPGLTAVNQAIARQWGIDLSRSWALQFAGRAMVPIGLFLLLLAWGLTGLIALPLDQRAVNEQFGRPVAVLQPGLHLLLPWPLGVARRVERGVLHELTLGGSVSANAPGAALPGAALPGAEDSPPQTADRLWDRSHPGEATYLIASPAASGQGFQRVDVDLRLITRVGLSDVAALQAAYGVDDVDTLVRASAGRLLARHFASRTLAGLLGEDRQNFTDAIRAALQQDLDRLATGVEIVAVVVEAIHPPPATAEAWHNVESAQIRTRVGIADENGAAAKVAAAARTAAERVSYGATAAAAELLAKADADQTLFAADHTAYTAEPEAFRLERWLARLRMALPRAQLLVLDHRLVGAQAPTLDLRDLAPIAPTPP